MQEPKFHPINDIPPSLIHGTSMQLHSHNFPARRLQIFIRQGGKFQQHNNSRILNRPLCSHFFLTLVICKVSNAEHEKMNQTAPISHLKSINVGIKQRKSDMESH